MTIVEMFGQSGVLALTGMTVVFSFLVIMVFAITLAGKVIGRFVRAEAVRPARRAASSARKTEDTGAVTAAISAAVNNYRNQKN